MKRRPRRNDAGYTLIELIISITLLATITGALVAAFITTNNANANTSERIHESNDAQLTSGFWTADAQAAGGIDPALGGTDGTLGVLAANDNGGCSVGAGNNEIIAFKWREWANRTTTALGDVDTYTTRVALYAYNATTLELTRRTCANGTLNGATTLATRVASAPTTSCSPSANCPGLPDTIEITVRETNVPRTGPTAYQFTLSARVRPDRQATRDTTNSQSSPLLVLGGSCTNGYGMHMQGGSGFHFIVNGAAAINTTDGSGCTAVDTNGSASMEADSVSMAPGGSCPQGCGTVTTASSLGNPFAALPVPPGASGCAGAPNATAVNGHYSPGTYQTLTLSGAQVMDPGTYVLCNGLAGASTARSTGVFIYVAGGTITASNLLLTAPTSGPYTRVAMWNATANDWNVHQDVVNIDGAYYAPSSGLINGNGNTSVTISVLVVKYMDFGGSSTVTVTGTGTPRSPDLNAQTGSSFRTVNLSWTPKTAAGLAPITSYDYRADRGSGVFGAWTPIAGGAATTSLIDTCGSSSTVATTCYYQVRANNSAGVGSPSNIAYAASLADSAAPTVSITAPSVPTTLSTTFSGAAGNVAGDLTTINVTLYDGAACTGTPIQTYAPVTRSGASWTLASGALTPGTKCVMATQADTAGNVGTAMLTFAAGTQVVNGGTAQKADRSDTISVVFPRAVNESTLCNTWTTNVNQSITGNNVVSVVITDGGAAGNDVLTISTASGCTFNFGSMNLGSPSWVNATTTYKGTGGSISRLDFTAATNTLKITLGTGSGSGASIAPATMTYTPAAAIKDTVGGSYAADYAGKFFVNEQF